VRVVAMSSLLLRQQPSGVDDQDAPGGHGASVTPGARTTHGETTLLARARSLRRRRGGTPPGFRSPPCLSNPVVSCPTIWRKLRRRQGQTKLLGLTIWSIPATPDRDPNRQTLRRRLSPPALAHLRVAPRRLASSLLLPSRPVPSPPLPYLARL
jgi:hypothetical protein